MHHVSCKSAFFLIKKFFVKIFWFLKRKISEKIEKKRKKWLKIQAM